MYVYFADGTTSNLVVGTQYITAEGVEAATEALKRLELTHTFSFYVYNIKQCTPSAHPASHPDVKSAHYCKLHAVQWFIVVPSHLNKHVHLPRSTSYGETEFIESWRMDL